MKCPKCKSELLAFGSECYEGWTAECSNMDCVYERKLSLKQFEKLREHNRKFSDKPTEGNKKEK